MRMHCIIKLLVLIPLVQHRKTTLKTVFSRDNVSYPFLERLQVTARGSQKQ